MYHLSQHNSVSYPNSADKHYYTVYIWITGKDTICLSCCGVVMLNADPLVVSAQISLNVVVVGFSFNCLEFLSPFVLLRKGERHQAPAPQL